MPTITQTERLERFRASERATAAAAAAIAAAAGNDERERTRILEYVARRLVEHHGKPLEDLQTTEGLAIVVLDTDVQAATREDRKLVATLAQTDLDAIRALPGSTPEERRATALLLLCELAADLHRVATAAPAQEL